jgi:hypothetical protein
MMASHRKLSRLPLDVFQNLIIGRRRRSDQYHNINNAVVMNHKEDSNEYHNNNNNNNDYSEQDEQALKRIICHRLAQKGCKTVGQLLQTSKCMLLVILDPVLTYGTFSVVVTSGPKNR